MSDPFRDRIENLLREGKISPEEANKLFRALEAQGETVEKSTPTVGQGSSGPAIPTPVKPVTPTPPTPPTPPAPPVTPVKPPPIPDHSATRNLETHEVHKFTFDGPLKNVIVNINSGDIEVIGIPGNHLEVESSSLLSVVREDEKETILIGASGKLQNPTELGFLDTVFKAIGRVMPVSVKVKVPANLSRLEVKALAGQIDVLGVNGQVILDLSAGDIKLRNASQFEINSKAGNVTVDTKLENGESKIKALAGQIDVRLEPGSSVSLKASTQAGNVGAKGFILSQTDKRVTGGSLEGRLGAGRAKLEVSLSAGDLDVTAIDGEKQ
jgi:Putative adhesin